MSKHQQERLYQLIEAVKLRNGKPVNARVVSATIESLGIRDVDIKEDYGFTSIPELGLHIFNLLNTPEFRGLQNEAQLISDHKKRQTIRLSNYLSGRSQLFVKDYSTGLFHLLPVAVQILSIIIFGFSLWAFVGFNKLQSTSVVLGVVIGLVVTGGFVQVIGKQVSFYWYNEDFLMAKKAIYQIIGIGLKSIAVLFLVIGAINCFIFLYPFQFIVITFIYAFLIGLLLLTLAPLYTIKQRYIISISVTVGTLVALGLHFYTKTPIYLVHWLGILISAIIPIIYLQWFFKRILKTKQGINNGTPKIMLAIYRNLDYFFYGLLYYVFIFTDRILAWSTSLNRDLPYVVYYEKDYEIGMDLAILVFFLLAGVLEYSVAAFSRFMEFHQYKERYSDRKLFNAKMRDSYMSHVKLFAASALVIALLLYLVIVKPWGYEAGFDEQLSDLSIKVSILGGFGYLFLTFGMLNVLYLYTLNVQKAALRILIIALLTNIIIGLFFSRMVSYEYAVLGMLIGSLVFAVLTTRFTLKFFKKLDYYYYASY